MKKYIAILLTALLAIASSCSKYSYPQDETISTQEGILTDTLGGFIPSQLTFDGTQHTVWWDAHKLGELNDHLLTTKEVVLYNYYLGRDIYRLVLLPKDQSPIIITVNKEDKNAWLVSKRINPVENQTDSTSVADSPLSTALQVNFDNYMKPWNQAHTQRFDSLFAAVDFFHLPASQPEKISDNYYLMEVHQKDKYWYVRRPMDDSTLAEIIEYMRSFSRF